MQQSLLNSTYSDAIISQDLQYRYLLSRQWAEKGKTIAFIGLNPSTADAYNDDPTIRRCIGYAKQWGGNKLLMGNLFAFRSTDPNKLAQIVDPVGPDNDQWLDYIVQNSELVVAAWGVNGQLRDRNSHVLEKYKEKLSYLKLTKNGHPSHPLYLSGTLIPIAFGMSN